jgi:transcription elongation factor Elf1
MAKKQKANCPNCNGLAAKVERDGQTYIACASCEKVYQVTETGHKVRKDLDWFGDIEQRLNRLEGSGQAGGGQDSPSGDPDDDDGVGVDIEFTDSED